MRPDELMARAAASGIDLITTFQQSVPEGQERALRDYHGPIPKQTRVYRTPAWTAQDAAHACIGLEDRLYAAFAYRFAGDESQRAPLRAALLAEVRALARAESWKLTRICSRCEGTGVSHQYVRDRRTGKAIPKPEGGWETITTPCAICVSFGKVLGRGQVTTRGAGQVVVIEQLVDLAIFEEWLTVHYITGLMELARDRLWAGLIGIDQEAWERIEHRHYRAVQCVIDRWCGAAYGRINDNLAEDDEGAAA